MAERREDNWRSGAAIITESDSTVIKVGDQEFARFKSFTVETVQKILVGLRLKQTPLKSSPELTAKLNELASHYFANKHCLNERPTYRQTRKKLEHLEKAAGKFREALKGLDDEARQRFYRGGRIDDKYLAKTAFLALATQKQARKALEILPHKPGAPRADYALRTFIVDLAKVYEEITGRKARVSYSESKPVTKRYYGPFYRFVEACLKHIGQEKEISADLGNVIRETLKWRREVKEHLEKKFSRSLHQNGQSEP